MILKLSNGSASNPQTVDLSPYVDVQDGQGLDFANPEYSAKVWGRSLLKAGATLALTHDVEREILIPLKLGPIGGVAGAPTTLSQTLALIQQINAIVQTPGATLTWQPDGAASATVFDGLAGQVDVEYQFRREQQRWTQCKLRFFAQPFGRTAAPRPYAAASGVGPLLLISPYASGGALATVPSAVGFGASGGIYGPNGASGGISYSGNPSLAGDAPALLQVSYVGPLPASAADIGVTPTVAISLLPGPLYRPLVTAPELQIAGSGFAGATLLNQSTAVASSYQTVFTRNSSGRVGAWTFNPLAQASYSSAEPTGAWAGQHRLFAIARASGIGTPGPSAALAVMRGGPLAPTGATAVLDGNLDWSLYDLGTFTMRGSEPPANPITVQAYQGESAAVDLTALIMLPDNFTWFFHPGALTPSSYGVPPANTTNVNNGGLLPNAAYTNTILADDVIGDQFIYWGPSQTSAPSPLGSVASAARVTQYSRGLIPAPDPKNGLPIIAILGVGQNFASSFPGEFLFFAGASWPNQQTLRAMAQVNVLEKARYVLP